MNQISLIETIGVKYAKKTRYENFFVDDLVKDEYSDKVRRTFLNELDIQVILGQNLLLKLLQR